MSILQYVIYFNLAFILFITTTFCIPTIFRESRGFSIVGLGLTLIIFVNMIMFYSLICLSHIDTRLVSLLINFTPTILFLLLGLYLQIRQKKISKWLNGLDGKICVFQYSYDKRIGKVGTVKYGPFILYMYYINGQYSKVFSLKTFQEAFLHIATEKEYEIEDAKTGYGDTYEKIVFKNKD